MPFIITLDIFSGRKNPMWKLSNKEAKEFKKILSENKSRGNIKAPSYDHILGYRGFKIECNGEENLSKKLLVKSDVLEYGNTLKQSHIFKENSLEKWLLKTGKKHLRKKDYKYALENIKGIENQFTNIKKQNLSFALSEYTSSWWNINQIIKTENNCYNYANDCATNTFAQPGRGTGQKYTNYSCNEIIAASVRDGLREIAINVRPKGNLIYLAIAPQLDYHWWRLDKDNFWSHKPGSTDVTNLDSSGLIIVDPENCNRGKYTLGCGFLTTDLENITIN